MWEDESRVVARQSHASGIYWAWREWGPQLGNLHTAWGVESEGRARAELGGVCTLPLTL